MDDDDHIEPPVPDESVHQISIIYELESIARVDKQHGRFVVRYQEYDVGRQFWLKTKSPQSVVAWLRMAIKNYYKLHEKKIMKGKEFGVYVNGKTGVCVMDIEFKKDNVPSDKTVRKFVQEAVYLLDFEECMKDEFYSW